MLTKEAHMRTQLFVLVLFCVLTSSCGVSPTSTSQASTPSIDISEAGSDAPATATETIRMNNCGGKASAEQEAERSLTVEIEGETGLGVDIKLIRAEIIARYRETKGVSKRISLTAPPGTDMVFRVAWTEQQWIGTVTSNIGGSVARYHARVPISVELIESKDQGCDPSVQPISESPTVTALEMTPSPITATEPTNTPPLTATEPTAKPPEGFVPFTDPNNTGDLNPVFGWESGGAPENTYSLTPDTGALVLIAGPQTNHAGDSQSGALIAYPVTGNFEAQLEARAKFDGYFQVIGFGIRSTKCTRCWLRVDMFGMNRGQERKVGLAWNTEGGWNGYRDTDTSYASDTIFFKIKRNGRLWDFLYSTNGRNWSILQQDILFEIPERAELFISAYSNDSVTGVIQMELSNFAIVQE